MPAEVDDVVQRTLARTPVDRFGSAGELAQALRSGVATPTATRVLESTPETAEVPQRRAGAQRTRWLVAGGVAALTLTAMVAFMRSHERPVRPAAPESSVMFGETIAVAVNDRLQRRG